MINIDHDLWKKDRYLSELRDDHQWVKLLCVDIFDTLILRTCLNPGDVFYETGRRALEKGLLRMGMTAHDFQFVRQQSGYRLYREKRDVTPPSEETIGDIYEFMSNIISGASDILALELQVEKDYAFINPVIMSLISHFKNIGRPVALLTDMYLKKEDIEGILSSAGFPLELADILLVSNESGANKGSGAMFELAMSHFPHIQKDAVIHIGDNPISDAAGARRAGIRHILYGYDKTLDMIFNWEGVRYIEVLPELSQLRKLAARLSANVAKDDTESLPWFSIGAAVLGPFFSAFADWVVDICRKEDRHRVFPIMRGGTLIAQMIENSARHSNYGLSATPLYVSRQATSFAALGDFNAWDAEFLFIRRNITVRRLFELLELPEGIERFSGFGETLIQDTGSTAERWSLRRKLLDYLTGHDIKNKVDAMNRRHRELLITYLGQTCGGLDGIVTVDFGFQGTIQNNIHHALKAAGIADSMTHLVAMGEEGLRQLVLNGVDIRGFAGSGGENLDMIRKINRSPAVIEDLILEGIGTTVGYELEGNGCVSPVLDDNLIPANEVEKKRICVSGILEFQSMWLYFKSLKPAIAAASANKKRQVIALVHRLVDMPTPLETQLLSTLHHEDNYGSKGSIQICKDADTSLLDSLGAERFLDTTRLGFKFGNVLWPQGVVSLKHPTYIFGKHSALNNSMNYFSRMNDMVTLMLREGIGQCIIYGAGDIGLIALDVADINGLKVKCIVDGNENLWGGRINDLEVMSLSEAMKGHVHCYAIASHLYAIDIVKTIEAAYEQTHIQPRIYAAPWYF